jgi:hypothetical protein
VSHSTKVVTRGAGAHAGSGGKGHGGGGGAGGVLTAGGSSAEALRVAWPPLASTAPVSAAALASAAAAGSAEPAVSENDSAGAVAGETFAENFTEPCMAKPKVEKATIASSARPFITVLWS